MKTILIYSEISWNFLDQRHHHLARYAAANGYKVEFIQRVVSRVPSVKEIVFILQKRIIKRPSKNDLKEVPDGIKIRNSFFLPSNYLFSNIYNWIFWFLIERHRQKNSIVYCFANNPEIIGGSYPFFKKYSKSFFDIIHNWWDFPWHSEKQRSHFDNNIKLFDKIITDSPVISKRLESKGITSHLMLPGVTKKWLDISTPSKNINPVFFGNLRSNSDLVLVNKISSRYGLDIFGRIDENIDHKIQNVVFKGLLKPDELIKKISKYNLILLPYDRKNFSETIVPAKYFEALATGALVVTGSNKDYLPGFSNFVFRFESFSKDDFDKLEEAFIDQIEKRKSQVNFAEKHLWKNRFSILFEHIGK